MSWTPRTSSYRANGLRFHVLEDGPPEGPAVILLHGFPECARAWHRQAPALAAAGFRVVAPDQRGYGWSDKPHGSRAYALDVLARDVVALADACGIDRFRLAGHDWGGVVAWWTAARHDDRVQRLAVINAPHPAAYRRRLLRSPVQAARSWYIAAFQCPVVPERLLARRQMKAAVEALTGSSRPGTFTEEELAGYREAWSQPGAWTGMVNWYRAALRHAPAGGPLRIRVPTLVLWGDRDRFLVPALADDSLRLCDDGRLVRLPDASHWVQHEEAAAVNDALLGFFGG
jgi:pimeloyl-ACP methyl ester carboxylesterase